MNILAVTEHTVTVEWPEGYTFGDSFQHAQGKFAAARALGLKVTTKRIYVSDAVVENGLVYRTTWVLR